jgi:segregation and condensation protein B
MDETKTVIEALILAAETPLSVDKMAEVLQTDDRDKIRGLLAELIHEYEMRGGGIILQEVAGGYQFRTRADLATWIKRMKGGKPSAMTPAAMETLAIVAYRQPVVKAEVDKIRGVDVGGSLKTLLEKKLIRIIGRKDVPGRPMLYGTTRRFLEVFNLKDLSELPTMQELTSELPVIQELISELPTAEETASESLSAEELTSELPLMKELTSESPTAQELASELPATEDTASESPTEEELTSELPVIQELTSELPAAEEAASESPSAEELTSELPATKDTASESPTIEKSTSELPITQEAIELKE